MDGEIENFLRKSLEASTPKSLGASTIKDWDELLSFLLLETLKHLNLTFTQSIPQKRSYTINFVFNDENIFVCHYVLPIGVFLTAVQPKISKVLASEVFCTPSEKLDLERQIWDSIPNEWIAAIVRFHAALKTAQRAHHFAQITEASVISDAPIGTDIPIRGTDMATKTDMPIGNTPMPHVPMGTRDIWPQMGGAFPESLIPDKHGGFIPGNIEDWSMRKPAKPEIIADPLVPLNKNRANRPRKIPGEPDSDELYPPGMHMDPFY